MATFGPSICEGGAAIVLLGALAAAGGDETSGARDGQDGVRPDSREKLDDDVVVLDTLRPDHLGLYGYAQETAPFLAELAQHATVFATDERWDGSSLAPLLARYEPEDLAAFEERTLFAHRRQGDRDLWAAIRGPWKWIEQSGDGRLEALYHLLDDPHERVNRAAKEPRVAQRLRQELDRYRQRAQPLGGAPIEIDVGDELREQLDPLGCVEDR
jgi:hypothetical protein